MHVTVTLVGERRSPRAARFSIARRLAHQQPRVVVPDRRGPDQDRVAPRTHVVDAVEVGLVGEDQPLAVALVEVAVDRDAAAQQGVGTLRHGRSSSASPAGARRRRAGWPRTPSRRRPPRSRLPAAAPSPAAANAQAATPSRGPQPATLAGMPIATSTSSASGTSWSVEVVEPTVRAATRKVSDVPHDRQRRRHHDHRPGRPRQLAAAQVEHTAAREDQGHEAPGPTNGPARAAPAAPRR